jgi:pimeloyl-ACP methyl ester carboxylesterase
MVQDGIEVSEYLRSHLHKDKIILLGHSWGSLLGVHMVHERPDLFAAYVGTSQYVNLQRQAASAYPLLIDRAIKLGNPAVAAQLRGDGPPPYPPQSRQWVLLRWANESDPGTLAPARLPLTAAAPWQLWRQLIDRPFAGAPLSHRVLWRGILAEDLPSLGLDFKVPMYFFQGSEDLVTTTAVVQDYYQRIHAPAKDLVVFPGHGHTALFTARERFLRELVRRLPPEGAATADPGSGQPLH